MLLPNIDELRNQNTIWHYTKVDYAIKYILYELKLRLSPVAKSIDPIENSGHGINYSNFNKQEEISDFARELRNKYIKQSQNVKQLSFCMNEYADNKMHKIDKYGFIKPRMWDQYGDHYKGVCFGFDKKKLKINEEKQVAGKVVYYTYDEFIGIEHFSINAQITPDINISEPEYIQNLSKKFNQLFFKKHIDYIGENEYRIISFSETDFDYIDIEKSINCIIISGFVESNYDYRVLRKYAKKLNIPLIQILWIGTSIDIQRIEK